MHIQSFTDSGSASYAFILCVQINIWFLSECRIVSVGANKRVGSDTLSRGFYRSRAPQRGKVMKTNTAISLERELFTQQRL